MTPSSQEMSLKTFQHAFDLKRNFSHECLMPVATSPLALLMFILTLAKLLKFEPVTVNMLIPAVSE